MDEFAQSFKGKSERAKQYKQYVELYRFVTTFYHHMLINTQEGERAFKYLLGRGFTKETIIRFNLGWSHQSDMLRKLLLAHGHDKDQCEAFGLLKPDKRRNGMRTGLLHNRIVFPITNGAGEVVAFSGRVLPGDTHPAKYLNTPDTPFFQKGEILFNMDAALASIKSRGYAILFEGYLDTMAAVQGKLENTTSVMGTSLTIDQIEKLSECTDRVVVCYDGDEAGMESAKRIGETLIEHGLDVRLSLLPEGTDPHEYITNKGIESFRKDIIAKSVPFLAFCKEYAKRSTDFASEPDKLRYANNVLDEFTVGMLAGNDKRLLYELASEVGVSMDVVREVYRKSQN